MPRRFLPLLLAVVLAGLWTPAVGEESCTPVPESIDSTGQTEVAAQLDAFLDSVPDGSCVAFPHPTGTDPARFLVNGKDAPWATRERVRSISLDGRTNLDIRGNGSALFATRYGPPYPGGRDLLSVSGSTNVDVSGMRIDGIYAPDPERNNCLYSTQHEFDHGVAIVGGSTGVDLHGTATGRFRVTDFAGSLVHVQHESTGSVSYADLVCTGTHAVVFASTDAFEVSNSFLHQSGRTMVNIEPHPNRQAKNVEVLRNVFGRSGIAHINASNQSAKENITVVGNVATFAEDPLRMRFNRVHGATGLVVEDNQGIGTTGSDPPIGATNSSPVRIVGNTQAATNAPHAISLSIPFWCFGGSSQCMAPQWVCPTRDVFAAGNDFAGAKRLFPLIPYDPATQPDPYEACGWIDGGGNRL